MVWLVLIALAIRGVVYRDGVAERREREAAEQRRQATEQEEGRRLRATLDALADQAERERCQEFVRAMAPPVMSPEPYASKQAAMNNMTAITVCSDPQSPIRQRLRFQR